jgi:hypothetical protein
MISLILFDKVFDNKYYFFLTNRIHDDVYLNDIHTWDSNKLDIQWLFPVNYKEQNSNIEPLSDDELNLIKNSSYFPIAQENIRKSFKMMLKFYGFTLNFDNSVIIEITGQSSKLFHFNIIKRLLTCLQLFELIDLQQLFIDYFINEIIVYKRYSSLDNEFIEKELIEKINNQEYKNKIINDYNNIIKKN